ncbi:DedA family protein [Leifsonia sp. 1010]|uniref:DedA family protein n=1 Tax=Leifsonia sp. 1010 TaxID=2817769 RepID=UPI0028588D3F|nr:DedA family protein [Leifsonia sp. 1010]MDR6613818.1 membrane-associated protein [Leifsonia sp. 1010]
MTAHLGLLDPQGIIQAAGPWALLGICAIAFIETGLLVGFFLPGDTLLFFTGVLALAGRFSEPLWVIIVAVIVAAALGDQVGYLIGRRTGPRVFERKESGFFSRASVDRTQRFFDRFGGAAVMVARFVPVVRTFAPVAAGVGKMRWPLFTVFNVVGAAIWATAVIMLGYGLGHIPGVADFVSSYLDLVLIGIVVISVVPVLVRVIAVRRRTRTDS